MPQPQEPGATGLLHAWLAIRRSWPLVIILVVTSLLVAGLLTHRQQRVFRSSATVEIDPAPPRPLGMEVQTVVDANGSYWNNREYFETQLRIISSSTVAAEVVRQLKLDRDSAFLANVPSSSAPVPATASVERAVAELRGRLSVEPIRSSRLVLVHLEDTNPARAQRILSALVNAYLEQNLDNALESANSAADWLSNQLVSLKNELEVDELDLHNYKKMNNILSVSLSEQSNMLRGEMQELNTRTTQVRAKIEEINARNEVLKNLSPDNMDDLPSSELLASSGLHAIRQRYLEARSRHASLLAVGRGEQHPEVLAAAAEVGLLRTDLMNAIRDVRGAVENDLAAARKEAAGLMSLFKASEQRALDLNLKEIDYRRREREKDNTEKLYTLVLERSKSSELTRMMKFNNLHVIEPASTPRSPIRPRVPVNLAIGGGLGMLLGIVLAIGRDRLDRSIKSAEGMEQLGLSFLGALPEAGDNASKARYGYGPPRRAKPLIGVPPELVVHHQPSSSIAEASRAIRTSIRFSAPDRPFRSLLVTSAGPSEGKTTVACCIAIAMAQTGQRVLLLDCDLRRPRVHQIFKISNDRGTTDAVLDSAALDTAVHKSEVDNLFVLPAGPYAPNPADLINSEKFVEFLDAARARFDVVLIDSAPILPVTDSTILATRVDGTILIVRSSKTSKENLAKAARTLTDVGGRIVGAILNGMAESRHAGYYYAYQPSPARQAEQQAANG